MPESSGARSARVPRLSLALARTKSTEDSSHRPSGNREKVFAVLPVNFACASQPDERLVYQCRCLEGDTGTFAAHTANRLTFQVVVKHRGQLAIGFFVASMPGLQQPGHLTCG